MSLTYDIDQLCFRFFDGGESAVDVTKYLEDCPTTMLDANATIVEVTYHDGDDKNTDDDDDSGEYPKPAYGGNHHEHHSEGGYGDDGNGEGGYGKHDEHPIVGQYVDLVLSIDVPTPVLYYKKK